MIEHKEVETIDDLTVDELVMAYYEAHILHWNREPGCDVRQLVHAYCTMAKHRLRTRAPGDGFGHVSEGYDLSNISNLLAEANKFAIDFIKSEDAREFNIGCSDGRNRVAMAYAIEIARMCCGGAMSQHGVNITTELLAELRRCVKAER